MYILISHRDPPLPLCPPHNNVLTCQASPCQGYTAFVRHQKNGHVYCIDLASQHGTSVDGARCPEHKPVKMVPGSTVRFGACTQQYGMEGLERVAVGAAETKVPVVRDKENLVPQGVMAKKALQQQQQQQASRPYNPNISSFQFKRDHEASTQSLALLPQPCLRDASAARKLQLPATMMLMLQVGLSDDDFIAGFVF
jgi:hypothetical protein